MDNRKENGKYGVCHHNKVTDAVYFFEREIQERA